MPDKKKAIAAVAMADKSSADNKKLTEIQKMVEYRQKNKALLKRMYPNSNHSDTK
jgi:hypothetical protein